MACFEKFQEKKPLLSKTNMAAQLEFVKLHLNKHKTSGVMCLGQIKPKWSCLAIMHNPIFGENQTQHINTNTNTSCALSSTGVEE